MSSKAAIAIDIGATNTRIALVDKAGRLIYRNQTNTIHSESNAEFVNFIKDFLNTSLSQNEIYNSCGIGVCVAGFVDTLRGTLIKSPNLPNKDLNIVEHLESYFQKTVVLSNDTNAAILGEKLWGYGKNVRNFAFLTFSSGIGGSVFLNNKLVTDELGGSIEIGHIQIESNHNLTCGCGGINHWESYASGINMPKYLQAWSKEKKIKIDFNGKTIFTIFEAIDSGNKQANIFFDQVMKINLVGINYLINKFQSEVIILGGSVYLKHQDLFNKYLPQNPIFRSAFFGDNAPLIGSVSSLFSSKQTQIVLK